MEFSLALIVSASLLLTSTSSQALAQTPNASPFSLNLTNLLAVAGPFHNFLDYLSSTKVIDTFQNQANNSTQGITIFVPKNAAFSALDNSSLLSNLTQDQLKQIMLFHALPHYYSLADFCNLGPLDLVPTFAGAGQFALNISCVFGVIHIDSMTRAKVTSSVYSHNHIGVYQINKVLLPRVFFGTDMDNNATTTTTTSELTKEVKSLGISQINSSYIVNNSDIRRGKIAVFLEHLLLEIITELVAFIQRLSGKPPPPPVEESELGKWPLNILESKWTAWVSLATGLGFFIYAGLAGGGDWKEFFQYFRQSKFIHVMSLDFALFCAFAPFWVYNDMTARKWYDKGSWLLPLSLVPMVGPALYLILRPRLSELPVPVSATSSEENED